jgi:hypothetical protein
MQSLYGGGNYRFELVTELYDILIARIPPKLINLVQGFEGEMEVRTQKNSFGNDAEARKLLSDITRIFRSKRRI